MNLVYSVALFGLAAILSVSVLLSVRMPDEPWWASEGLIANVWCVAITGLIAFGTCFGVRFAITINQQVVGLKEVTLAAATLAACYLTIRLMAPRRRLAEYAAALAQWSGVSETSQADVVTLASPVGSTRSPSEPTLPKVA